jgi:hypothetical protein
MRVRARNLLLVAVAGLYVGIGSFGIVSAVTTPRRATPLYDPPVLAGQQIPGFCSGGFHTRHGDSIVLTTTPHCASDGWVANHPSTGAALGVFGPTAKDGSYFPCMIASAVQIGGGDSGGAVLVRGLPAGVISLEEASDHICAPSRRTHGDTDPSRRQRLTSTPARPALPASA